VITQIARKTLLYFEAPATSIRGYVDAGSTKRKSRGKGQSRKSKESKVEEAGL
jgi:hypothetical protein